MKNIVMACALVGFALIGISGCSDNPISPVGGNDYHAFKVGNTYTYEVYDRDESNARVTSSKTTQTWTVVRTGINTLGKLGVSLIEILTVPGPSSERDTLFVQSSVQGPVYIYDALGAMVGRVQPVFRDSVPKQWVKISDTKLAGASSWASTGNAQFITIIPNFNITVTAQLSMDATHTGQVASVMSGDSTYTNSFHTDHSLKLIGTATNPPLGQVLNDSVAVHYDVDINAGIVHQTMDSKSVTITGVGEQPVAGFEMNLIKYTIAP